MLRPICIAARAARKCKADGKKAVRYLSRPSVCRTCALRQQCLSRKGRRREIERWEYEDVLERHRARMHTAGEDMMRRRKALAEHPFGTLKCRAGYRHFLVRGFAKVRGEWSLMALCYNFSRVLRILGLERWLALLPSLLLIVYRLLRSLNTVVETGRGLDRFSPARVTELSQSAA
jgi:hypothetical protein